MRRLVALAALAGLAFLTACDGPQGDGFKFNPFSPREPEPPRPVTRREALDRVNENLARIDQPLQCKALVSFSFRDEDGRQRRYLGQEAALFFARPRLLRFDVRSPVAGVIAQFGSTEQRYWLWIEPELQTLWWGDWRRAGQSTQRKLPVPPNQLLDALMLRPLPETLDGRLRPTLRVEPGDTRLVFTRLGADRQPAGVREIRLDARPPYQPIEVIDRSAEGEIVMHARLFDYRPIQDSNAYTPRRYEVRWPASDAELKLDITRAVFRPDLTEAVFQFPATWAGRVERIDLDDARPARQLGPSPSREDEYPWARPRRPAPAESEPLLTDDDDAAMPPDPFAHPPREPEPQSDRPPAARDRVRPGPPPAPPTDDWPPPPPANDGDEPESPADLPE
ncbi:MAG: hypothetical protein IPM13_01975 [Phycisphaerales bacterium]|nr:hypothetical protein [Phycisphaerales bacterium]